MKLVVIYGPVAAGKLSTAQELAKITKFKVFHNHLTNDLIAPFYVKKDPPFFLKYRDKIRLDLFEFAAKNDLNLIFTFCYDEKEKSKFVKQMIKIVERYKGKIYFVQLIPKEEVLYKRIKGKSRKKYNKTKTKKVLKKQLSKFNYYSSINHKNSLKIDNTKLSPKQVASKIKKHYKLK